jgi:hypothetical protein
VAERVVDVFEFVEIDQEETQRLTVGRALFHAAVEIMLEIGAVHQPGEGIVTCGMPQLTFHRLSARHGSCKKFSGDQKDEDRDPYNGRAPERLGPPGREYIVFRQAGGNDKR